MLAPLRLWRRYGAKGMRASITRSSLSFLTLMFIQYCRWKLIDRAYDVEEERHFMAIKLYSMPGFKATFHKMRSGTFTADNGPKKFSLLHYVHDSHVPVASGV